MASDTDDATVTRTDVLPAVTVLKTADPLTVPETGGDVKFTYEVKNTGTVTAWITSLSDDKFGTLAGDDDCKVGTELAAGASCTFDATFAVPAGVAGSTHTDVFTGGVKQLGMMKALLRERLEARLGIPTEIRLVEPRSIDRSHTRAQRITDRRMSEGNASSL